MCDLKIVFTISMVLAVAVATSVRNKRQDYVALGSPLLLPLQYSNHLQIQPITRDNLLAYNLLLQNPNNLYVNGIQYYQNSPSWNLLPTSNAHHVEYITQYPDNLNTNQDEGYHTVISNQGLPIEPNSYNSYTGLNDYSTIISDLKQIEALREETKQRHHHQEENREGETRSASRDNLNALSNNVNSVSNNFSNDRSNSINSDGFVKNRGQETAEQTSKSGVQRNISNDYSKKSKFLIEYPEESFSEQNKFLGVLGNLGNNFLRGRSNRETLPIARNQLNNKDSSHQNEASGNSNSEASS